MSFPKQVKLVEVGPRDGLQNEKEKVPTATKIEFINQLSETGLSTIEATSFVSPQWIPQLADHRELYQGITKKPGISYPVLIPNLRGLESALEVGVSDIAVFTSPSEQFSQHNINCSVAESLDRIAELMKCAKEKKLKVRGYLSCTLGCPYEGKMAPEKVAQLAGQLLELGCHEISLGDTIGVGTIESARRLIQVVSQQVPLAQLAVHFHDTFGQALANITAVLDCGISIIDSSVGGLGGCPYAKGASGNVATEDVLYLLKGLNIQTGVDLPKLIAAGRYMTEKLGKKTQSKVSQAWGSFDYPF